MDRIRGWTVTIVVLATGVGVVLFASPAWAPPCGLFSMDIRDADRVWVGTVVAVDDA